MWLELRQRYALMRHHKDKAERYAGAVSRMIGPPTVVRLVGRTFLDRAAVRDAVLMVPAARHITPLALDATTEPMAVTFDVSVLLACKAGSTAPAESDEAGYEEGLCPIHQCSTKPQTDCASWYLFRKADQRNEGRAAETARAGTGLRGFDHVAADHRARDHHRGVEHDHDEQQIAIFVGGDDQDQPRKRRQSRADQEVALAPAAEERERVGQDAGEGL